MDLSSYMFFAVIFLHRNSAKYQWAYEYLSFDPVPRAWAYFGKQDPNSPWDFSLREVNPASLFVPSPAQELGFHPMGEEAQVLLVPKEVSASNSSCIFVEGLYMYRYDAMLMAGVVNQNL